MREGAQDHLHHRRKLRSWELRDVRTSLLSEILVHVAQRPNLGNGRRAGRQRPGSGEGPSKIVSLFEECIMGGLGGQGGLVEVTVDASDNTPDVYGTSSYN